MLYEVITQGQTQADELAECFPGRLQFMKFKVEPPFEQDDGHRELDDGFEQGAEILTWADPAKPRADDEARDGEQDVITSYSIHYTKLYDQGWDFR